MDTTTVIGAYVIVSAVLTTLLLKRRGIPQMKLWEAETFDWQMGRRAVISFVLITGIAQLVAAAGFVNGKFAMFGVPVVLWAIGACYVYLWIRCIWLLTRSKET
jgi:hypothetical protein